ncbi:type II toxin-antitoxin system RelE/ParE family toxin [Streptococcus hongkongensis]|nr:hypothetical protein NC01_06210 [Streptococcus uberis]
MTSYYKLVILPLFEDDLNQIVDYIKYKLKNPSAAHHLVNDVEKAILQRLANPLGFPSYKTSTARPHPYYTIRVKHFTIFYVVIEHTMGVRRILYAKRQLNTFL